jgi:hypothetical protein
LFDLLPGSSLPSSVAAHGTFPSPKHTTLAALAFSLLYELDYQISKVYQQEGLWK